ncbi:MAG TPA: tetratricopeptide repeat protein [Candidatus Saccharicenans sp.]|jgi:predicted negative regulator of RcsB-dependent stress response|nr:tetratricopeptide repeat protein [Candidatus Saccharicenans sp.]HQM75043.1 tetratricopeptide repeat protein [Candidatus Saccharicenans sp.]
MKRTERKQLKENELASGLSRFFLWVREHGHELKVAGIAILVVVAIILGLRFYGNYRKSQEANYLSQVLALRAELDQKPENLAELEKMAGSSRYGRIASLSLATYYFEKNDFSQAEKILERVKDKGRDLIHYQILDLYGQVLAKQNKFDEAISVYRQIEKDKPKSYPLDIALFHLAEVYEKKGDREQAINVYRQLQGTYQNTYYGYQAALKVMKLQAGS